MDEKDNTKHKIHLKIMHYLARRDYAQHEIIQKLKMQGFAADDIVSVLAECIQVGLVNDKRFTENYIDSRRQKGYGPKRIYLELQYRGIAEEIIADLLEITDNAWLNAAQRIWRKRFKNTTSSDLKTRAKQWRFLQARGFTQEQIEKIILLQHDDQIEL